MPYTAQFFSEKLNLPVEYFNPLRNLQIDDSLPREELAKVAHSLGEVVGLGLRNLAHCPVELNLMPKSSLKRQEFNQKKPYLVASVFCLILVVFAFGWFYERVADEKQKALDQLKPKVDQLKRDAQKTADGVAGLKRIQGEADNYFEWMEDRFHWASLLTTLRDALIVVEDKKEKEFNTKTGVWIEKFTPVVPPGYLMASAPAGMFAQMAAQPVAAPVATPPPARGQRGGAARAASARASAGGTNQIDTVLLTCRSVNLTSVKSDANTVLAEALAEELRGRTNQFVADGTKVTGDIAGGDVTNLTFTFQVTVKLAKPMNISQ
jgi:hypothetical protein